MYSQTLYLPLDNDDDGNDEEEDANGMDIDNNTAQSTSAMVSNTNNKRVRVNSKTSNKTLAVTPHLSGHLVGECLTAWSILLSGSHHSDAPTPSLSRATSIATVEYCNSQSAFSVTLFRPWYTSITPPKSA